jgi:hypothetical protein
MNHQPFENWLLSEEPLTKEQSKALQEHLDTCETCSQIDTAWNGVQNLMRTVPEMAPVPGFSVRWQKRLAEQRRKQQQRQSWIFLAISGGIAFTLMAAIGVGILSIFSQPEQFLIYVVYRLTTFFIAAEATREFLSSLTKPLAGAMPFAIWIGLSGLAAMLSAMWFVLFKRLTTQRRVVQ